MRLRILRGGVRKASFLLLIVAALAVPSVVLADRTSKGDGTLSVRDGYGKMTLGLTRGIVFGRVDSGRVTIDVDSDFEDFGTCTFQPSSKDTYTCRGNDLRFRFTTSKLDEIRVGGRGINVTAVGQGSGRIQGSLDALDVGTYSVNGSGYLDLPVLEKKFTLGVPPPVVGG
jgi:hypothetical protein